MDIEQLTVDRHMLQVGGDCVYAIRHPNSRFESGWSWEAVDRNSRPIQAHGESGGQWPNLWLRITTEAPASAIVVTGPTPMQVVRWTLRDRSLESPAMPLEITPALYATLSGDSEDVVSKYRYEGVREPDPDQRAVRVELSTLECQPIPVKWEEPPTLDEGLAWVPSPAFVALWGPAAAPHLLPGHLTGVARLVMDQVASHPWVRPWTLGRNLNELPLTHDSGRKVSFYFDRRFEGEPTKTVMVKPSLRARKKVPQQRVVVATETVHNLDAPPDRIPAENLAAALRRLPDVIEAEVDRIMPPTGHVCGHCNGAGYITKSDATPEG